MCIKSYFILTISVCSLSVRGYFSVSTCVGLIQHIQSPCNIIRYTVSLCANAFICGSNHLSFFNKALSPSQFMFIFCSSYHLSSHTNMFSLIMLCATCMYENKSCTSCRLMLCNYLFLSLSASLDVKFITRQIYNL